MFCCCEDVDGACYCDDTVCFFGKCLYECYGGFERVFRYGVGDVGIYAFCTAAPECKRFDFRNITTDDVEMDFFD